MVHAEGADATFDFEKSGGLIEDFRWEIGFLHDFFTGTDAFG